MWPECCNERGTGQLGERPEVGTGQGRGGGGGWRERRTGERPHCMSGEAELGKAKLHVMRGHIVCQERQYCMPEVCQER